MITTWSKDRTETHISEIEWEFKMQRSGLDHYEAVRYGAKPVNTVAGQGLLRTLIETVEAEISEQQSAIFENKKIDDDMRSAISIVPADTLSLIGLKEVIDRTYTEANVERGYSYIGLAQSIGKAIEAEANYRHWQETSKTEAKEYAESAGLDYIPKSLASRLTAEKGVTHTQLRMWKRKFSELSRYEWTTEQRLYVGDFVLSGIIRSLPRHFEENTTGTKRKTTKHVRMTDWLRNKIDQKELMISKESVIRKPMLTKPVQWEIVKVEGKQ